MAVRYGKLRGVSGPMMSGKTTALINIVNGLRYSGRDYVVYSHCLDKGRHDDMDLRASFDDYLISHCGAKVRATMLTDLADVNREDLKSVKTIVIDEIQFFPKASTIAFISWARGEGIDVHTGGLSADFTGTMFPICPWLYINGKIKRLYGTCALCPRRSTYSQLTQPPQGVAGNIVVGGADKYRPLCQPCFAEQCGDYYARQVQE